MIHEKRREFNVLAGAATVHGGSFLLLQRSAHESFLPNVWGIPAGQVRPGEDPEAACVRELKEETGLLGRVVSLVGYSTFESRRRGVELSNVQLNFLVYVDDVDVKLNDTSHSHARWISVDDPENELLDSFTRKIMELARPYCKNGRVDELSRD
jgi:8-oxo-dGTP pyrophosphatase MutT (NUDIX family)